MKYFSLFSGIGGFELGIQKAYVEITNRNKIGKIKKNKKEIQTARQGLESSQGKDSGPTKRRNSQLSNRVHDSGTPHCVGYSEIDKHAIKIYEKYFPKHKNFGDIKKINARILPRFDLLVAGFPCQSFSIAGKRKGFDDTRGTLFFDIARIARVKRPRFLLLENVKGLLSHEQGRTFATILRTLDELGYDLQWQVLNSKNYGVPQNRERVLIVGHLRGTPRPEIFPLKETDGATHKRLKSGNSAREVAKTIRQRYGNGTGSHIHQLNNPRHSNDRVYGTNGISPTINTMQGGNRQPFIKIPEATKKGYAEAKVGQSINLAVPNSKTRRGRVSDVAQTLDTGMQQHTLTKDMQVRRLTPTECERLQGFPDGWTEGLSDTQRYKTLGNAVTVNLVNVVAKKLMIIRDK
jgi:DNA (cytosine-5)-methyltransferase 1